MYSRPSSAKSSRSIASSVRSARSGVKRPGTADSYRSTATTASASATSTSTSTSTSRGGQRLPPSIQSQKKRLKKMLMLKLKAKYAGRSMKATEIIETEVDIFVSRVEKITTTDLNILEQRIKQRCITSRKKAFEDNKLKKLNSLPKSNRGGASSSGEENYNVLLPPRRHGSGDESKLELSNESSAGRSAVSSGGLNSSRSSIKTGGIDTEEWMLLDTYQQLVYEKEEGRKDMMVKKRRKEIVNALQSQIKQKHEVKTKAKTDDKLYADYLKQDTAKWKQEELKKEDDLRSLYESEKKVRQTQINANQRARQEEKRKRRQEEVKALAAAKQALLEENLEASERRAEQRLQYLEVVEENKRQKKIRVAKKDLEAEHDLKLMQQYKEMLDKQEADRSMWYEKTYEKQAQRQEANKASRVGEFAKEKELEQRILDYTKMKQEADKKNDEERKSMIEKRRNDTNKALAEQILRKKEVADRCARENKMYAATMMAKAKQGVEEDMKKAAEKRAVNLRNRHVLEAQMKIKKCNSMNHYMSEEEVKMNQTTLKKVTSDPLVLEAVKSRLHSPTRNISSKKTSTTSGGVKKKIKITRIY